MPDCRGILHRSECSNIAPWESRAVIVNKAFIIHGRDAEIPATPTRARK